MATKEENQKHLRQLAGLLGREADMSGSAADIAQRVSEWEEELAASCSAAYPHDAAVSMAMAAMILHFIKPSLIPLTD